MQDELLVRDQRLSGRRVKAVAFRELKPLDQFDWSVSFRQACMTRFGGRASVISRGGAPEDREMTRSKAGRLPAELSQAAARWAQWRNGRQRGARIPEVFWQSAVSLAARYGVSKTATALKLGYYEVKKRLDAETPRSRQGGLPSRRQRSWN